MNCDDFRNQFDEFENQALDEDRYALAQAHIAACNSCQEFRSESIKLRKALNMLPVPEVDDGYLDRLIEAAISDARRTQRMKWIGTGFGGAIAAGIAAWVVFGMMFSSSPILEESEIAGLTISLDQTELVRLAFDSEIALDQAVLEIELPRGIEIEGYPDRTTLRWATNIRQGRNILELPMVANSGSGGLVIATVKHDGNQRAFKIKIEIV